MITEDYVSFEVAKLLKEKGFNPDECEVHYDPYNHQEYEITIQMAMKWLKEVHKLHIAILWDCGAYIGKNSFCYLIDRMDNYEDKGYNKIGFDSNKEACEAAIKYCLTNLI